MFYSINFIKFNFNLRFSIRFFITLTYILRIFFILFFNTLYNVTFKIINFIIYFSASTLILYEYIDIDPLDSEWLYDEREEGDEERLGPNKDYNEEEDTDITSYPHPQNPYRNKENMDTDSEDEDSMDTGSEDSECPYI